MITLPNHVDTVLIVADASDNAAANWQEIHQVIRDLIAVLPDTALDDIYFLGRRETISAEAFSLKAGTFQPHGVSLVAPVMSELSYRHLRAQAGILVGSGVVFDLEDHLTSGRVEQWAAVRTGKESLLPEGVKIPEFTTADLSPILDWIENLRHKPNTSSPTAASMWSTVSQRWNLDRAGYPLILIEPYQTWMHLFPVCKPHFETYLAAQEQFRNAWYQTLLGLNPRKSYQSEDFAAYEELILTGILSEECLAFAQWLGPEYHLPVSEEWRQAYRWLATQPPELPPPDLDRWGLAESAKMIWNGLFTRHSPASMLELSLMNQGVMEWLAEPMATGLGKTRPSFRPKLTDPLTDEPTRPIRQDDRLRYFGFRLFWREQ